ncbi:MAG: hypothetical protein AB1710_07955 [Pseudomonadota bacterium]
MGFNEELVKQVWEKARASYDADSDLWREDECGAWINRHHYGRRDLEFGWLIENVSAGGPDTPENLRAFHHGNAFDRAGGHPKCHVSADRTGVASFERTSQPRNKNI